MIWIDQMFAALDQGLARPVLVRENGISLLEILRYRFLFEFAEVEQRWNVISEMLREGAERILWIAPRSECSTVTKLTLKMTLPKFDVVAVERSRPKSNKLWRMLRSFGRDLVDRLLKGTENITNPHPLSANGAGGSVTVVEYYPNSAKR